MKYLVVRYLVKENLIEETIPWDVNTSPMRSKHIAVGSLLIRKRNDIVVVLLRAVGDGSE